MVQARLMALLQLVCAASTLAYDIEFVPHSEEPHIQNEGLEDWCQRQANAGKIAFVRFTSSDQGDAPTEAMEKAWRDITSQAADAFSEEVVFASAKLDVDADMGASNFADEYGAELLEEISEGGGCTFRHFSEMKGADQGGIGFAPPCRETVDDGAANFVRGVVDMWRAMRPKNEV